MINKTYIVASCKNWHRPAFDLLAIQEEGKWLWADSAEDLRDKIKANPDLRYIFFLHWNWKVSEDIWSQFECVCFHMTDVPYGRGGSPLQNLISAGHKKTKLSALRMVDEMDAGPVYAKKYMSLDGRAQDIYLRAGALSFDLIRWIVRTQPLAEPQNGNVVVFKRRRPEQSILPEHGDLSLLHDHIRMLDAPTYPLAYLNYGDFRLEFSDAVLVEGELRATVQFHKRIDGEVG